jgi:predicted N-formylglutamate amidohydrolase
MTSQPLALLSETDPPAFQDLHPQGRSDFVILVDHASCLFPRSLGTLGLPEGERRRHIAWDIGALGVALGVSEALDARLVAQNYSRLVIDCNRDPRKPSSIADISEWTEIPGNKGLSAEHREARRREIFHPYHERISQILDERKAAGRKTILVAQHTMTDSHKGDRRSMEAAILYNRDPRFALLMLEVLRRQTGLTIADNEPYFLSDETDYTIPLHGEARQLPYAEIEIRQDLVADEAGQTAWAGRIANALATAQRLFENA